jgi:hypothetical protein
MEASPSAFMFLPFLPPPPSPSLTSLPPVADVPSAPPSPISAPTVTVHHVSEDKDNGADIDVPNHTSARDDDEKKHHDLEKYFDLSSQFA